MNKNLNYKDKLNELANESYYFAKQKHMNFDTMHNGEVDAFRHIYSSALLTLKYGKFAQNLASNLYEIMHQNPSEEKVMDFYNNQVGQEIGENISKNLKYLKIKNDNELKQYIAYNAEQAIQNNTAITSINDNRIIKTLKIMPNHPLRIYTREDIDRMSDEEFQKHEPNIMIQLKEMGIPTINELNRHKKFDK